MPIGIAQFYFARSPLGGLKRMTARSVQAFHFEGGALPLSLADTGRMINIAALAVETEDRCPVRVLYASFYRYGVLEDGRLDPDHRQLQARAMARRMNQGYGDAHRYQPTDVIDAAEKFASRRLDAATRWTPTEAELAELTKMLGRRFALGDLRRNERKIEVSRRPLAERVALASESGPDWRLRVLGGDPEPSVRAAVAANGWAPYEVLEDLRDDLDSSVIAALAGNDCHGFREWLARMTKHESPSVRAAAAGNLGTPDHLVTRMAWGDAHPAVREQARVRVERDLEATVRHTSSPYAMPSSLSHAARDSRAEVRLAAARNSRLPKKMLPVLARDRDPRVKHAIAARLGIEGDPARLFPEPRKDQRRGARQKRRPSAK